MAEASTRTDATRTEAGERTAASRAGRRRRVVLWVVAVLVMLGSAVYQRLTGPTYPVGGEFQMAGSTYDYRLPRSEQTPDDARVTLPDPGGAVQGTLRFRRYPTDDDFTAVTLTRENGELVAAIPAQPPAGKVEYYVTLRTPEGVRRLPGADRPTVILRFKGPVPAYVLAPHVLFMFLAVLVGMRAGLAAAFEPRAVRPLAWTALGLMTVGGMVLGPVVQKHAFGEYWTGFPFGYDLTDNKVLVMWLVWLAACAVLGWGGAVGRRSRAAVGLAALVMMAVYLIPHSAQGSELDYEALERGVPAAEAVRTGRGE